MNVLKFTITGRIPSKKNSRNVFVRGGKPVNIPSKKYEEWHNSAATQLPRPGKIRHESVEEVQMEFWLPDNRACDLTNKAESVMDLLVDCGYFKDDCWQVVPRILLHGAGIDRKNPRVDIWVKSKEMKI